MALRVLSDAFKIPLDQHTNGVVTLNGTFNGIPRTFVLDTTLSGLAHTCKYHSLNTSKWEAVSNDTERYDETCPDKCSSNLAIPAFSSKDGTINVDPFAANLTVGDFSIPRFTSGRICDSGRFDALWGLGSTANGVFGLGPGPPTAFVNGTAALDAMPWSTYSIFLTKSVKDAGSFLLQGGVDSDLIAKEALVETTLPASTEATGWTVNIDAFSTNAASIKAACSPATPCKATIAVASPVMQLGTDVWNSVLAGFDRRACVIQSPGPYSVYICKDWAPLPTLTFTLGGRTFTMNKTDYTIPVPNDDTGNLFVMVAQHNRNLSYSSEWILGAPFLRSFYSSFDKDTKTVSIYCKDGVNCMSEGQSLPGASSSVSTLGVSWSSRLLLVLVTAALALTAV